MLHWIPTLSLSKGAIVPVLEKHLDGDGYYARASWGEDRVGTWQISPAGVDWLEVRGCEEGQAFSRGQLDELIDLRYATNDGALIEGFERQTRRRTRVKVCDEIEPLGLLTRPRLILQVIRHRRRSGRNANRVRWYLELSIPGYQEPNGTIGRALRKCQLIVTPPGLALSVESLNDGPRSVEVPPHAERYTVTLHGRMPAKVQCGLWTSGAEGLNPAGTLFTYYEGDSRRLLGGQRALPRKGYYLLTRRSEGKLPVPSGVVQEHMGNNLGWNLRCVQLPSQLDGRVSDWLWQLGYLVG